MSILNSPSAAYIHVPFCRHRCGYCDFTLVAGKDHLIPRYLHALDLDLRQLDSPRPVNTLFLGGGTPSHLSPEETAQLLSLLKTWFPLQPGGEFSLEANPLDITPERLALWKQYGITRVSLGIQSFDDQVLKLLERDHRREDIRRAVSLLREHDFHISLDLIFGVPHQTLADWQTALDEALDLQPQHLSTYGLTFEKGTSFWTRREQGLLPQAPDELERDMYALVMDYLPTQGFPQYEISNFAPPAFECRHNQVYWSGDHYYGHGPGAARYLDGTRATNHRSVTTWLNRLDRGLSPLMEQETLEPQHRARELLFLGLRRNAGINRADFLHRTGLDLDQLVGHTLRKHLAQGHLADTGTNIHLTREGRFLADTLIADYLVD